LDILALCPTNKPVLQESSPRRHSPANLDMRASTARQLKLSQLAKQRGQRRGCGRNQTTSVSDVPLRQAHMLRRTNSHARSGEGGRQKGRMDGPRGWVNVQHRLAAGALRKLGDCTEQGMDGCAKKSLLLKRAHPPRDMLKTKEGTTKASCTLAGHRD